MCPDGEQVVAHVGNPGADRALVELPLSSQGRIRLVALITKQGLAEGRLAPRLPMTLRPRPVAWRRVSIYRRIARPMRMPRTNPTPPAAKAMP